MKKCNKCGQLKESLKRRNAYVDDLISILEKKESDLKLLQNWLKMKDADILSLQNRLKMKKEILEMKEEYLNIIRAQITVVEGEVDNIKALLPGNDFSGRIKNKVNTLIEMIKCFRQKRLKRGF